MASVEGKLLMKVESQLSLVYHSYIYAIFSYFCLWMVVMPGNVRSDYFSVSLPQHKGLFFLSYFRQEGTSVLSESACVRSNLHKNEQFILLKPLS